MAFLAGILGFGCGEDAPAPACDGTCDEWQTVLDDGDEDADDLGVSLFSVNGPAIDDLYFAGGTLGVAPLRGVGLHFDGETWEHLPIDVEATLWWVNTTPEGTAWFAGEQGTVVEYRDGVATVHDTPADATLFGIWGTSDSNVWSVGGDVGESEAILLHWDGDTWTLEPPPDGVTAQLFKVWGAAADDVWVVGGRGTILHFDGQAWTVAESPTTDQLFTVHGRAADDVWAVGLGPSVLHYDGQSWTSYLDESWADPTGEVFFAGAVNGVYVPEGGDVCVAGGGGVKAWIPGADAAHLEDSLEGGGSDFHGVWCDACGNAFAVGGNFMSGAATNRHGAIDHHGCAVSSDGLI